MVAVSRAREGAEPLDRCHFLNTGSVRFLRDGTLLVVPAVEQGMYLYERSGKLLKTWDMQPIGFSSSHVGELECTSVQNYPPSKHLCARSVWMLFLDRE